MPRTSPRLVSSIEATMATRPSGKRRGDPLDALLHAMRTVKTARFAAAERLERKNTVSLFSLSMVSLYFVGLSVWQVIYGATLDEAANRLITLVSIMSSVFTLVIALIEALNDYRMKAYHMHNCALAVNDLYQELKLYEPSGDIALVQEFRRRYTEAVRGCPCNHSRVDYLAARAERSGGWEDRIWARVCYAFDVYALYALCLLAPPLVLLIFR